jgi:general secretion pathway protein G
LIELLVVIAIIAALAAVVAPAVFRNVGDARSASAKTQVEVFRLALTQYRNDNSYYPTTEQGLQALRTAPSSNEDFPSAEWRGPYLTRDVPVDPWGRAYLYQSPGVSDTSSYDLYSLGRDGKVGGSGEDADITSWGGPIAGVFSPPGSR